MKSEAVNRKAVLVTGANGYIGNAVAKAFSRAGWRTYGLIRRREDAKDLAVNEIHPIIGSPLDLSFLDQVGDVAFDVIVSNTEDTRDPSHHFEKLRGMFLGVAERSQRSGVRPLVMFTSGCKDYGPMAKKHGDEGLAPHTESSPLAPPVQLKPRAEFGIALLRENGGVYDATVLRPTIVYGHSSSHYGGVFALAARSETVLRIFGDPDAIMHSLHVDDCGDAYVALANHANRDQVAGQAFNISNMRYETAQEIAAAVAKSYALQVEFVPLPDDARLRAAHSLTNFWQWVGSDKLRRLTGWRERKPSFAEGIEVYRLAYEATLEARAASFETRADTPSSG